MAVCKGDAVRLAAFSPAAHPPQLQPQSNHQLHQHQQEQPQNGKFPLHCAPPEAAEVEEEIEVDLREVYFLIMHFLSSGPCHRATGQLWNELLQHKLLPRRFHALYSRNGVPSADENDDGSSFPLSYLQVTERYQNIESNHLIKLLQQLLVHDKSASLLDAKVPRPLTAADVPTLLGSGAFSLLESEQRACTSDCSKVIERLRWPHWQADQVHALAFREIGGGFAKHHRCPSTRTPKHVIAKPSVLVDRIDIIKVLRGHRNAVYCAVFDRTGRYLVTGSDDRLVKIWSAENRLCLRSCRGHEGDITDLAVSNSNTLVASASNDSSIRVWRLPDGVPVSVLRGHTAGVTAIEFSPRQGCEHHLLSSSEDGTCRIWDARDSSVNSRVYMPKPDESAGAPQGGNQILCCAFNADGSFFVTGSSDKLARVWDARKWADEVTGMPNHELDILSGHENVVNYVQFSGCAEPTPVDNFKEDRIKTTWCAQDSIVTCSRDGTAIIWSPRPRKQAKLGRWVKAYHLKVPPPPMPQPPPRTGGPRQRPVSTPRGVNMIVWSLDNRFVLAAIMDCRICVWNAVDGSLVHCLTGHNKQTYVLDVHPYNPRIAMSAGYDGRVIIWDIWEGRPVRTYETGDFNLVDGNFSPDGTSLVVSDEVGQVYLFSTGKRSSEDDAQYDQFFLGDYRPLVRDTHGNVLDQETQIPPHQRNLQDLLCDASMLPYPEPYQSSYQQRRLGALGIDWQPPTIQLAVGTLDDPSYIAHDVPPLPPPQVLLEQTNGQGNRWVEQPDAMDLDEDVTGWSDDSGSDYCASEESPSDDDRNAESGSIYDTDSTDNEAEEIDFDGIHTRRSRSDRNKRREELNTLERQSKRRRLEESSNGVIPEQRSRRHRSSRTGKRAKATDSEQTSRPRRVAARNALTMFSSLHEEEDDDAARPSTDNSERPGVSGENQRMLRSTKALKEAEDGEEPEAQDIVKTVVDTAAEVGECRRPRSQRKLVLKFRNCSQKNTTSGDQNFESSDFTDFETVRRLQADEIADSRLGESNSMNEASNVHSSEDDMERKDKRMSSWRRGKRARLADPTSSSSDGSNQKRLARSTKNPEEDASDASEASPSHSPPKLRVKVSENGAENQESTVQNNHVEEEPPSRPLTSESERSLSAGYTDDQKGERNQTITSNESLQNGRAGDADNDPDYHEEASPASNSDEEAYKPEREDVSDELDDRDVRRNRNKTAFARRNVRRTSSRLKSHMHEAEGGRRKSTRLAHGFPAPMASRMSTRNRGKSVKRIQEEPSSSFEEDGDSEWDRSSVEGDDSESHKPKRRTSTRLKGKLAKNVGSRYKDFHVKRNHQALHRNPNSVTWLLLTEVERTRYIPQFGDHVVYFRQGHQDYIETKHLADDGPWKCFKSELRAVEFCDIIGLEYVILPETGDTCCQLTLQFTEGLRIRGRTFSLSLPELTESADFIVERSRYEASMARKWSNRDKCQIWWRSDDDEAGGRWWEGRVVQVKAKSPEFPNSPWDSISVQYKEEPLSPTLHSPWELHDIGCPAAWDYPQIDAHGLLAIIDQVLNSSQSKDEFGLWRLQQAVSKPDFLDRIPLPMSMNIIRARLEKSYYRSLQAPAHDLRVLIDNFRTYFGKDHSAVLKLERLKERFSDVLRL